MATRVITGNIGKSKGRLYMQEGSAFDPTKPVIELGLVNPFSHTVAVEKDELMDARFGNSVTAAVDYGNPKCTLAFTLFTQTALNRGLANGGSVSGLIVEATVGAATTLTIASVKAGDTFMIPGSGPIEITGITDDAAEDPVAYAETDFGYDADSRLLQINSIPSGAEDGIVISYKEVGVSAGDDKSKIRIGDVTQRDVVLIFVATSKMGPRSKIVYPKVTIPPAGERSLIGDDWTSFAFSDVTASWDDGIGGFALEEDLKTPAPVSP